MVRRYKSKAEKETSLHGRKGCPFSETREGLGEGLGVDKSVTGGWEVEGGRHLC